MIKINKGNRHKTDINIVQSNVQLNRSASRQYYEIKFNNARHMPTKVSFLHPNFNDVT